MSTRSQALDLTVQITTPENIRFEYRLAGPFRRAPAWFFDLIIRLVFFVPLFFLLSLLNGIGLGIQSVFVMILFQLLWFVMSWFYGAILESTRNGRTFGKLALGIRVMSTDGRPINGVQAILRNFFRVADVAPLLSLEWFSSEMPPAYAIPTFFFGFLSMMLTSKLQRLGDLAAGTMVVIDERSTHVKAAKLEDERIKALASYVPASFHMSRSMSQTLALYVDRRGLLSVERRAEIARILSEPLISQFGFRPDISPDLFLCALYYREFIAPSSKGGLLEPFGPSPLLGDQQRFAQYQSGAIANQQSATDLRGALIDQDRISPELTSTDLNSSDLNPAGLNPTGLASSGVSLDQQPNLANDSLSKGLESQP